jgi:hypothetical protein
VGESRGPFHNFAGARLPIADGPKSKDPCDRNSEHTGGIRFELRRYGRNVGQIRLCEFCIRDLVIVPDPDPRYFEEPAA